MKISEIVKVNLTSASNVSPVSAELNLTAGVIVVVQGPGSTDVTWKLPSELLATGVEFTGKNALGRLVATYSNNGGVNLLVKRLFTEDLGSSASIAIEVVAAVNSDDRHTALPTNVINVMLIDEAGVVTSSLLTIASGFKNTSRPEEEKILMINTTSVPTGLGEVDNILINYYDRKAEGGSPAQNNYEVALAAAYVSKINYASDIIRGFEYTPFQGYDPNLNNLNIANSLPSPDVNGGTYSNIITYLIGRYLVIGGIMTNGANYLAKYFSIVLTQKITNTLAQLVVSKLKFQNTTYSAISNTLTEVLDVFAKNQLLDFEYTSPIDYSVTIDDVAHSTVRQGDMFTEGYRVFTLPPSQSDLANKQYSGVYVYIAIGNQIRTINISGLVLGGV